MIISRDVYTCILSGSTVHKLQNENSLVFDKGSKVGYQCPVALPGKNSVVLHLEFLGVRPVDLHQFPIKCQCPHVSVL